jgi:predicted amidophosphoribosyltransferase
MYCSSCGTTVVHGLAYCNHCGEKMVAAQTQIARTPEASPESLVWAIVMVFVVGMGTIIGLMAVMKNELHFDLGLILFFSMISFALMTAIEAVFVWMLLSRNRRRPAIENREDRKATKELGAAPARVLSEPIPSVTEETTRAFDPIYEKRK